ncbi:hypothetical protein DPMN_179102 [Dreissena polymorpha]|uniref:Uncharacterized protein n=1 Tax=Dreissena polymorpha TaxID=45954 RepID=A0A9D4EBT2_DREPO|nr:hypothetical protein DPMN_179102 [Dreissena polymorpha]
MINIGQVLTEPFDVFQATRTSFELVDNVIGKNLLTRFHEDRTIKVASRVLTRTNGPLPGGHVFKATRTIFVLIQDNIKTNPLTKFHDDRTIHVASRVLTSHIMKNAPPSGGHVFKATRTTFTLIQDNIKTNHLTKFHDDRTINVASRVLTRKNTPPSGGHVVLSNDIMFELVQDIIRMNLPTKLYEDRTIFVASRVLTSHIEKNAPPPGSHVFQANITIFELFQDIIEINLLTEFHEDLTINVASRVLTRQMLNTHDSQRTTDDGQKAITKAHHEHIVSRFAKND